MEHEAEKDEISKFRYFSRTQSIRINIILISGRIRVYSLHGKNGLYYINTASDLDKLLPNDVNKYTYTDFINNQLNVEIGDIDPSVTQDKGLLNNWVSRQFKIVVVGESE